ncbi:unnamed protein product [Tuber melanosporum]|uniref:(Perigord truffle) hypothetical protein n=1 Tax=Tuber melanosporum (strain Mel28) TaxID=656061 RepID=D5GAP0_TUBMM|nr:uncharacterized protein GSTUM_00003709001 [Tuber melanosporum]CAZ81583.1 unnamed protein product [Tuber melanosporum]
MTVLTTSRIYSQKSIYTARGDFSVLSEGVDTYSWQVLRPEVHDGKCTLRFVGDQINPMVNTQLSWLKALAGASNVRECGDSQALKAAGDPAIFWGLIALSIERGVQPSGLTEVVNRGDWRIPPEEKHTGRVVVVDICCDPRTPKPKDYDYEFPGS